MDQKSNLSVIICSYNREKYILDAIKSIANQTINSERYEVIIIDNNSTDSTPDIVPKYLIDHNLSNFHYFTETSQGLTFARNKGIKKCNHKLISFIDDDAIVESNYVETIINSFDQNPTINALGGKVIPVFPETPEPKWMSKYIEGILSKVDLGEKTQLFKNKYPVGCNMVFRKIIFEKYGTFNTDLVLRSDEKDLFLKIKANKEDIMYIPQLEVKHVMSAQRVSKNGVQRVSVITGEGERFRVKHSLFETFKKLVEYKFKLLASFVLAIPLLFDSAQKAQFLIMVRWYILKGFLFPKSTLNDKT